MTKFNETIYEIAADNFGLITSAEARDAGISNQELVQYARRGRLERLGHGVYRLSQRVPEPNDAYAEALALVGPGAYLYGESVLGMLGLCPTNPATIQVGCAKRVRRRLPAYIELVRATESDDIATYDGIRSQKVGDAVQSALGRVLPERLADAVREANREGYLNEAESKALMERLERQ